MSLRWTSSHSSHTLENNVFFRVGDSRPGRGHLCHWCWSHPMVARSHECAANASPKRTRTHRDGGRRVTLGLMSRLPVEDAGVPTDWAAFFPAEAEPSFGVQACHPGGSCCTSLAPNMQQPKHTGLLSFNATSASSGNLCFS